MSDPQWQQGNQPYQQYGQNPVPPPPGYGDQGYPPQGQPGPGGYPPPGPQGLPPPPGVQQPYGPGQPPPGYPPQQGFPPPPPGYHGAPGFPPPKPKRTGLIVGSIVGALVLVVAIAVAAFVLWPAGDDENSANGGATPTAANEDHGIVIGGGPVEVDIWLDFGCPPCKTFDQANSEKIMQLSATNRIKVVYHPLNFLDQNFSDEYSTRAASAAVCAADEGQFEAYAGYLFDNQPAEGGPGLTEEQLVSGGTGLGLGDAFTTCVHDVRYEAWIDAGTAAMTVASTPAASINGTEVTDITAFADALAAATA